MRLDSRAEAGFAGATIALMAVTVCLMAFISMAIGTTFTERAEPHGFDDVVPGNFRMSSGKITGDAENAIASHMEFRGYVAMSLEIEVLGNVSHDTYRATYGKILEAEGVCHRESGSLMLEDEHGRRLPARYAVVAWR